MFTTIIVAAVFLGLLIASVILWAASLRLGLRWAGIDGVTTGRVVLAIVASVVVQIAIALLCRLPSLFFPAREFLFSLLEFVVNVAASVLVISWVFKARMLRSLQAWLPTLLPGLGMFLFILLVLKPFVLEAFVGTTNSMAPTLLGNHWQGECAVCGRPNFCTPEDDRSDPPAAPLMICENFHVSENANVDRRVLPPDRFLVTKFLNPRRWDLAVFQNPAEPATFYVMRLVGLPGETIQITDGAVWANGKKLAPPDALHGLEYLSQMPHWPAEIWGSKNRAATLGEDEYFVLGDFSACSRDSRMWEEGAPGHQPFAVPGSYVRGVVTHIYWPPQRWRILR